MGNYVLSLRAPKGRVPSATEEAAWMRWFEKIGGQIVDIGQVKRDTDGYFVTEVGGTRPDVLAGWIVVSAESMDAAVAVAGDCPMLLQGGSVEVGEMPSADAPPEG